MSTIRLPLIRLDDLLNVVRLSSLISADAILDAIKLKTECKDMELNYRGFLSACCIVSRTVIAIISLPTTMWGPAIVMVRVVCPSVCVSHANISESKRDGCMVTRKLE